MHEEVNSRPLTGGAKPNEFLNGLGSMDSSHAL